MRIVDDLPNILGFVRSLRKVTDCPKGIDVPCIFCLECEKSSYSEMEYDDGLVKITKNSILINLRFSEVTDIMDKALLDEIIRHISARYSIIMDKPEEGYDITFFVYYTDKNSGVELLRHLLEKFGEIRSILTQGRIAIRNWARSVVEKYFTI